MADDLKQIEVPPEVFKLYDAYCHGDLSRRAFLSKLSTCAVGGLTIPALAACVMPDYGRAQTAAEAARVEVPLQIHLASEDVRVNAGWPLYEAALRSRPESRRQGL